MADRDADWLASAGGGELAAAAGRGAVHFAGLFRGASVGTGRLPSLRSDT